MILLVTGSRRWVWTSTIYKSWIYKTLDGISEEKPILLVQGEEPKGTDTAAKHWAMKRGIPVAGFPAEWDFYKKAAGPKRNQWMLDFTIALAKGLDHTVLGVAFPSEEGRGTQDMIRRMRKAGITFAEIYRD